MGDYFILSVTPLAANSPPGDERRGRAPAAPRRSGRRAPSGIPELLSNSTPQRERRARPGSGRPRPGRRLGRRARNSRRRAGRRGTRGRVARLTAPCHPQSLGRAWSRGTRSGQRRAAKRQSPAATRAAPALLARELDQAATRDGRRRTDPHAARRTSAHQLTTTRSRAQRTHTERSITTDQGHNETECG